MSKTIFLDTQFVVALVNERDSDHSRAKELVPRLASRRFLTTEAILFEIGNSLARSFRSEAAVIIDDFLIRPNVNVMQTTREHFEEALALYRRHRDKTWGLVDCLSFVVMQKHRIVEALTNDHHFEQAGFVALLKTEPKQSAELM